MRIKGLLWRPGCMVKLQELYKLLCIRWTVRISKNCLRIFLEPPQQRGNVVQLTSMAGVTTEKVWPVLSISGEQRIFSTEKVRWAQLGCSRRAVQQLYHRWKWHTPVSSTKDIGYTLPFNFFCSAHAQMKKFSGMSVTLQVFVFWVLKLQSVGTF